MLARPGTLLADDAGDPKLGGFENALLLKKLPRPASKGGGLLQPPASSNRNCSNCVTSVSRRGAA